MTTSWGKHCFVKKPQVNTEGQRGEDTNCRTWQPYFARETIREICVGNLCIHPSSHGCTAWVQDFVGHGRSHSYQRVNFAFQASWSEWWLNHPSNMRLSSINHSKVRSSSINHSKVKKMSIKPPTNDLFRQKHLGIPSSVTIWATRRPNRCRDWPETTQLDATAPRWIGPLLPVAAYLPGKFPFWARNKLVNGW